MTTDRSGPAVFVTVDPPQDVALVRGRLAEEIVYKLSPADFSWVHEWSRSARGWVVPSSIVADIAAYGQIHGELIVVHRRRSP
jgi:hypothetical protein